MLQKPGQHQNDLPHSRSMSHQFRNLLTPVYCASEAGGEASANDWLADSDLLVETSKESVLILSGNTNCLHC